MQRKAGAPARLTGRVDVVVLEHLAPFRLQVLDHPGLVRGRRVLLELDDD